MRRRDRLRVRPQDKAMFRASKRWAKQQKKVQSQAAGRGCALVVLGIGGAIAGAVLTVKGLG